MTGGNLWAKRASAASDVDLTVDEEESFLLVSNIKIMNYSMNIENKIRHLRQIFTGDAFNEPTRRFRHFRFGYDSELFL